MPRLKPEPVASLHHRLRAFVLLAPFLGFPALAADDTVGPAAIRFNGEILVAGQPAGAYVERTSASGASVETVQDEDVVLNRLGSRVEVKEIDTYEQDASGKMISGHFVASGSKTDVVTDVVVRPGELAITTSVGGRSYQRTIPIAGALFGPERARILMAGLSAAGPAQSYDTYTTALGAVATATVKYLGDEPITVRGKTVQARKIEQTIKGIPSAMILWVDPAGRMLRSSGTTPFGPIEVRSAEVPVSGRITGADLPADSYERTMAISNIRIPHPRLARSILLEVTARNGKIDWPDFSADNQQVIEQTPDHVIVRVTQEPSGRAGAVANNEHYIKPNAIIQSDDPLVMKLSHQIVGSRTEPWQVALAIQRWTFENMSFDPGIAVAPASELVRDRHGTCMGYSILFAALARAAGVPTRIRMGYVYTGGIWGGHAWPEVFVHGRWSPMDSDVYYPGLADAAHLAAITVTGDSGTIENIGELAKLYGMIDIRVLDYRIAGAKMTPVPMDVKGHDVRDGIYHDPFLGLTIRPPSGWRLQDAHWPDPVLVSLKGPTGQGALFYESADPLTPLGPQAEAAFAKLGLHGKPTSVRWGRSSAMRLQDGARVALAGVNRDVLWLVWVEAKPAEREAVLNGLSIDDLGLSPG